MNVRRCPRHRLVRCSLLPLLLAACWSAPGPLFAAGESAVLPPLAAASADLLQSYRQAVADDPAGSVQQRRQHGSLSLLEAVEFSLGKSLLLRVEQEKVDIAQGQFQAQSGAFDWLLNASAGYGRNATKLDSVQAGAIPPPYHYKALEADMTISSLALSKQLRSGPALSLSSQLSRNDYREDMMATISGSANPKTTAIVKLEAKIPLLNGVGRFASAGERAAEMGYEAGRYDYLQATAQNTLNVVNTYWDYKSAFFAYDVNLSMQGMISGWLEREEQRAGDSSANTVLLSTLRAKLADAARESSQARQQITASRQALALALGIDPANFATLAVPSEEFELAGVALPENGSAYLAKLTETAMARRPDLKAFTLRVEAAELLVAKAENNLKPRLDLVGSVGYTGLNESSGLGDYFAAASDSKDGEAWSVGLSFTYPWGNQTARGMLQVQRATKKISEIQRENLVNQTSSQLTVDLASLQHWVAALRDAETALAQYWQALSLTLESPLASHADLVGLLDIQEKLRDAAINHSNTLNGFAKAIATARFNSGTLVNLADDKIVIDLAGLTTLP